VRPYLVVIAFSLTVVFAGCGGTNDGYSSGATSAQTAQPDPNRYRRSVLDADAVEVESPDRPTRAAANKACSIMELGAIRRYIVTEYDASDERAYGYTAYCEPAPGQ
jgi:hypothetical protein